MLSAIYEKIGPAADKVLCCQRCDNRFRTNAQLCFRIPQKRGKSQCTHLRDPSQLLEVWSHHFQNRAKSQVETNTPLEEQMRPSASLISATFQKEEAFLDVPFTTQEVEHAVKLKKSAGPDNLIAEHLRYGGRPIST